MASDTLLILLLSCFLLVTLIETAADDPFLDPDESDDTVTVQYDPAGYLTNILLKEESGTVRIAIINGYTGSAAPTITVLVGNSEALGLEPRNEGGLWVLVVTINQDYEIESNRRYRIRVVYDDTQDIQLDIVNIDDRNPYFTLPDSSTCTVKETEKGETGCLIFINDEDTIFEGMSLTVRDSSGISSDIELVKVDTLDCQSRNTVPDSCIDAMLMKLNMIEYRTNPVISLTIEAVDSGNNPSQLNYVIQIEAENKFIPTITSNVQSTTIDESASIFNTSITFTIEDGDSGEMGQFNVFPQDDGVHQWHTAFSVVPSAGYLTLEAQLTVIRPHLLDYEDEDWRNIELTIVAQEVADETRMNTAVVSITVNNINDNAPVFDQDEYTFPVDENSAKGTSVGTVKATDLDGDKILYSLANYNQMNINEETGEISVNTDRLDYERQSEIIVTVIARDDFPNYAYSQVTISVQNINDELPQLYMPSTQPALKELTEIGYKLDETITAIDEDVDAVLTLIIDWDESRATKQGVIVDQALYEDCLDLTSTKNPDIEGSSPSWTATLTVARAFNWGDYDSLQLFISVTDDETDNRYLHNKYSNATMLLTIIDENNNAPQFSTVPQLRVREESDEGQLVGFVSATDADGPGNNDVRYEFVDRDDEKQYLKIDPVLGEIRTGTDKVDYETDQFLTYTVIAYDNDRTNEESMNFTIAVEDINDNRPYFVNFKRDYEVYENPDGKIIFGQIEADDDDISENFRRITYQTDRTYYSLFRIDPMTGELYVPEDVGERLDREGGQTSYPVQILIYDNCDESNVCLGDSNSNSSIINIEVLDVNDNPPEFGFNEFELPEVGEDVTVGYSFGQANAEDIDLGENGTVSYTLIAVTPPEGFPLFHVAAVTGLITSVESFMEKWGKYRLTINATDAGTPQKYSIADFIINVYDINNNPPEFIFPTSTGTSVITLKVEGNELNKPLTDIITSNSIQIKAEDGKDNGINGTVGIVYDIVGDDISKEYFELNGAYNALMLQKSFTLEMERQFILNVRARDANGQEGCQEKTAEATVILRITDLHEPTFAVNEWRTNFSENSTGLEENRTIDVEVTDLNNENCEDTGEKCDDIYYFIIDGTGKNIFDLSVDTGILTIKPDEMLDREEKDTYTLTVAVTNNNFAPQNPKDESKLYITIDVLDVKDTPPRFNQSLFAGGINYGDRNGDIITVLIAEDDDLDDVLFFEIVEESYSVTDNSLNQLITGETKPFSVNGATGNMSLAFDVQDRNYKGLFKFDVKVTDSGGFSDMAPAQVYVIGDNNLLTFKLNNDVSFARTKRNEMISIFSTIFQYSSNIKQITQATNSSGLPSALETDVITYFMNTEILEPIENTIISTQLNNLGTYQALYNALQEESLFLNRIEDSSTTTETDLEGVLQTVLIVVSVVLGTLVIVLFAAFFIRTRSLNRRLEALSTTKFGSLDSGLNRVGVAVPNTNKHAVEGSNPVWGNEEVGNRDFDTLSQSSGDSDLIGIEENPEFRQYTNNGTSNGGFTPDLEVGRRDSVNPMVVPGYQQKVSFNPLSGANIPNVVGENLGRRDSVNPFASSNPGLNGHDDDDDVSRRSSDAPLQNNNFSFMQRSDSTPTTEL